MNSQVLIDRKVLENLQERLDPHIDAVAWGAVYDALTSTAQQVSVPDGFVLAPLEPTEAMREAANHVDGWAVSDILSSDHFMDLYLAMLATLMPTECNSEQEPESPQLDMLAAAPAAPAADAGQSGHDLLWQWFSLSYAAWLTMPRVLMHEMPDNWQWKMAALLQQWNSTWDTSNLPAPEVSAKNDGKYATWPEWVLNYRHPDQDAISAHRAAQGVKP